MGRDAICVGDIVRLEAGIKPMIVLRSSKNSQMADVCYLSSYPDYKTNFRTRRHSGLILLAKGLGRLPVGRVGYGGKTGGVIYTHPADKEQHAESNVQEEHMAELYQTKESTPRFGTKLAVNSAGQIVLEIKGAGGEVAAFDPKDVEVVTPYTVKLIGDNGSVVEFETTPGQFRQDDIIFDFKGASFWKVAEVDTKCRQPRKNPLSSGAVRMITERLDAPRQEVLETFSGADIVTHLRDK